MSIIALLHNLLKEKLPSIHATRLTALMAAVEAGLKGASVSITQLGRMLSGPACIKHKIKPMDRLAGNHHFNTERMAVYGAMTQWLLQSLPMPLILRLVTLDRRSRSAALTSGAAYGRTFRYFVRRNSSR
jgi:hypothetical protein